MIHSESTNIIQIIDLLIIIFVEVILINSYYISKRINLSFLILILGTLALILFNPCFSQVTRTTFSQELVVGELLGKVDPGDLWKLIQDNYYPVISSDPRVELKKIKSSAQEVIYQLIYPDNNSSAHPKQVVFRFFESEYSLIAAIITEEVDFAITESYAAAEEIDKSTSVFRIHFRYKNPNQVKMIAYDNQHYILKNPNIRKALTHAINRNYIYDKILNHAADLADGPLSSESKLHISDLDAYKFNPRKTLQLLHSENWTDSDGDGVLDHNGQSFRISLTYEKGVLLEEQLATRIKIDWNKIGVDVIRRPLVKSEIKKKLIQRDYDVVLMSHTFEETIDSFDEFFESSNAANFLRYKNRMVDRLFYLYKKQEDPSARKIMFQAIQKQINKDHPAAFLFFLWVDRYFANQKKFSNFLIRGKLLSFPNWKLRN